MTDDNVEKKRLEIQKELSDWSKLSPLSDGITLYWANGSIPSMRVIMALDEKNIQYKKVRLKIMTNPKQTRLPEFLQLNPRGKTPTIVDILPDKQEIIIYESQAILEYIEKRFSDTISLVPNDIILYSKMQMRKMESDTFLKLLGPLEKLYLPKEEMIPFIPKIKSAQKKIMNELELLWNNYLSDCKYLVGDSITLADCAFWPILCYLVHHGLSLANPSIPNITRYYNDIWNNSNAKGAKPIGWKKKGKNYFKEL